MIRAILETLPFILAGLVSLTLGAAFGLILIFNFG